MHNVSSMGSDILELDRCTWGEYRNDLTGNTATFTAGSITTSKDPQYASGQRTSYNNVGFTIGDLNYVVSGFKIFRLERFKGSEYAVAEDKRVITVFANGVQVDRYAAGENLPLGLLQPAI
jgi:hypothetical protein